MSSLNRCIHNTMPLLVVLNNRKDLQQGLCCICKLCICNEMSLLVIKTTERKVKQRPCCICNEMSLLVVKMTENVCNRDLSKGKSGATSRVIFCYIIIPHNYCCCKARSWIDFQPNIEVKCLKGDFAVFVKV